MIYISVFLFLVITNIICAHFPGQRAILGGWLTFFLIFIGFRYNVGCDFDEYLEIFDESIGLDYSELLQLRSMEPLFAGVLYFTHKLEADYQWINVVCATIFLFGFHIFAKKQPNSLSFLALAYPILFIHMAMSGIRQATAIGILMIALKVFIEGKKITYAALVLVAAGFHTSAIAFMPLVFLVGRRISISRILAAGIFVVPALVYFSQGTLERYSARYLEEEMTAAGGPIRSAIVSAAGLVFVLALGRRWRERFPKDYELARFLALLTLPLLPLSMVSTVIADRFGYYLMPAQLAIFARIPYLVRRDVTGHILVWLPWVLITGFFAVWLFFSPIAAECYFPYDNYLLQ